MVYNDCTSLNFKSLFMNSLKSIYQHPLLTFDDLQVLFEAHTKVDFLKGDFLLRKDQIANKYFCVEKGLIRSHIYDYNGNDITTGFIGKNELAIDVISLFHNVPSVENFQALTDCECYAIDLEKFQELFHSLKGLSEWGRAWMAQSLFELKQRTTAMITHSATERYLALQKQHPEIVMQAPLKCIASYLGITDTSLSRIRKEIAKEGF